MEKKITKRFIKNNLPKRPVNANKGTMGTLLSITGSYGMAGASVLSSLASLKSGVGLLKVGVVKSIYEIVAKDVTEGVFIPLFEDSDGTISIKETDHLIDESKKASAVLIGCGIRDVENTRKLVNEFVKNCEVPLIIDADGLNALSHDLSVLENSKCQIVLTPHLKEMGRLIDKDVEFVKKHKKQIAIEFTKKYTNVTLVLKDYNTIVSNNGDVYINYTGNSGMAKGGSGDVLSGILSSLVAQKVDPFIASRLAVYIHGLSGDIAKEKLTDISMLPRDIIKCLSFAYKEIQK